MQINENEIQINKNEELSQVFPSTKKELNELQKSISPKERIKD